ncbi:MAG: hypothetical protein S4CHLAM20_13970 [Chlamydiia bacterium]|nr:hypothetical protein [Chlamydiia bacterium]
MQKDEIETKREIEKAFGFEYVDTIKPVSDVVLEKVIKRVKRKRFPLFNKKHNKWINSLYGEAVRLKKEAPYVIKKVNPLIGVGVFAKKNIAELSFIGEYAGELRARKRKDSLNDYVFGYMVGFFSTPWVIDAEKRGNFTRFINHSFDPNISSRGVVVDGVYHVIFFANRSIKKGEQLTYDYGPTYWRARPYPQNL